MRDAPNQIQGNDWVRHGLAPMTTTHIVRPCRRNGESRETYLHERRRRLTITLGG
jgi:hypothetical protein